MESRSARQGAVTFSPPDFRRELSGRNVPTRRVVPQRMLIRTFVSCIEAEVRFFIFLWKTLWKM